ncbi:EI24 domain-containing protein [Pararhodospirillum photometricum]|nr:EI24 domain-containing protein [Pararhodospirillum photometricum]
MFVALSRAFAQLPDPRLRRVLLRSVGLTLLGVVLLGVGAAVGVDLLQTTGIGWLETALDGLAGLGVMALTLVFFPSLVAVMAGLFLDEVADAVEARYYPALGQPRRVPLGEGVRLAGRFALISLGLNLVALPLYLIPGVNMVLFYGLNGYLISREFFEQAAHRRLPPAEARALRKRHQGQVWALGAVLAFLGTLPGLNLLLPLVGTACLVHLVERLRPAGSPS